jgi:crotonobetainyl-CoA:carnitine CoA-transferase CaiB-like acyl-CoA transferase
MQVLEGIRVVDASSGPVAGMATMVLADFGADVVKIEPPGGDRFRALPAAPLWLRGKRSVTADLHTADGRDRLHDLIRAADVLVVSGPPSRAVRWGVDAVAAAALNPRLVHCAVTGWGPAGPLAEVPGYEAAVAARSGRMLAFERQLRRGGPVFAAVPIGGHVAAHGAVQGITAALLARCRGAGFQRVETSLLQGFLPFDLVELLLVEMAERSGVEAPNILMTGGDMPTLNYHPVRCADGRWIQLGNLLEHLLYAYFDAIDILGDLLADDRLTGPPATWTPEAVEVARDLMLTRMLERPADEWMEIFRANGNVAAEPYLTTTEGLEHVDIVGAGDIVTLADRVHGPVRTIGAIAELTATPAVVGTPAPAAGADTATVPAEWSAARADPLPTGTDPPPAGQPLDGVTIVDLATIIAAPIATVMLADLGARVIKVEPVDGDPYRHLIAGGTVAAKTTAGKESIAVDLKQPDGRRIAMELCATADVVVNNWRPGVAERLGLGEGDVRAANPDVIWVAVTGYGRHSAAARRPATHPCAGAAAGGAGYQAGAAVGAPCATLDDVREIARQLIRANESNPDPNSGVVAAGATLLALLARERFGGGQAVYVNMLLANLYANADDAVAYAGRPPRPTPDPELYGLGAGYRLYPTADGWLFLAATTDDEWRRCAEVLGTTATDEQAIAAALATAPAADWERRLVGAGVAGVCADAASPGRCWAHDEQVLVNGFTPECTHTRFGVHRRWGPVVLVDGGPPSLPPGVLSGEQTDALLAGIGRSPTDIAALRAAHVVDSEPVAWT